MDARTLTGGAFFVEWVARKHDSLLDRCQAADLNSVKLTADGELIVSLPNWVFEMMEEFAADRHSWIKITNDPQTLPERGHFYLIVFFNRHIGMAWYGKNDWETVTRFTELRGMVTHWQPLPPPPES